MTTATLLTALAKMAIGSFIGYTIASFTRKNELSPTLGTALVVALTLVSCVIIDKLAGI